MANWDGVVTGGILVVFTLCLIFHEEVSIYIRARIDILHMKNKRENALKEAYLDGYKNGYRDCLHNRAEQEVKSEHDGTSTSEASGV